MNVHGAIVVCVIGLLFSLLTIELVRRKYLQPKYALLWAGLSAVTLLLALAPGLVSLLTWAMGMPYLSSVITLVFVFTAVMLMNYSVIASRHSSRIVRLTQEIALLRLEIEQLRNAGQDPNRRPDA